MTGFNGPDVLNQSGLVRSDIRSSFSDASGTAEGVSLTFTLDVTDMVSDDAPFAGSPSTRGTATAAAAARPAAGA